MTVRKFDKSPSALPLYAKAGLGAVPGAALLPFVGGRGKEIPDLTLELGGVTVDPEKLAAYNKVCGFTLRDTLPSTYPHVLAFPLHMSLMTSSKFPFAAVGLVHIENKIVQHRPIRLSERLELRVTATKLEPHPKGRKFTIVSEARVDGELVWEDFSVNLRRGSSAKNGAAATAKNGAAPTGGHGAPGFEGLSKDFPASAEWRLAGDLGRRYAAVSGDRNPIHMHNLTAKPLGFARAIAHGMWTKARCLAAIEGSLTEAYAVDVRFRKPVFLPAKVNFAANAEDGQTVFAVRDARKATPHLDGLVKQL